MAWRSVSLDLTSHCTPQSFAEFSVDFTHSAVTFNSPFPTSSLNFTTESFIPTTKADSYTPTGQTNSLSDSPPREEKDPLTASHKEIAELEVLLGIHLDHNTDAENLNWLCKKPRSGDLQGAQLEETKNNPLEKLQSALVILIVDGVEVLSRNTKLWEQMKNIVNSDDLQVLESRCKDMNLAEKNCTHDGKPISTSALLYLDSQSLATFNTRRVTIWILVKPRTQGRLHSDLWLFSGFAQFLKPETVGLLDAELVPQPLAYYAMLTRLRDDNRLAGVLGAPEVSWNKDKDMGRNSGGCSLTKFCMNLLKRADGFEMLYSQILYGPIENLGGYVSQPLVRFVLYSWQHLQQSCQAALFDYFKPFTTGHSLNWLTNNLYEFVPGLFLHMKARLHQEDPSHFRFKRDVVAKWYLPDKLVRWINYRARVLNANLLSYLEVINSTPRCSSRCCRLRYILIEFYFFHVAFLVKWFSIGTYYVLSSMSVRVFLDQDNGGYTAWKYGYLLVLAVVFFMSLGKQRERGKWLWVGIIALNVLQSLFNISAMLYNVIHQNGEQEEVSLVVQVGVSVICGLLLSFLLGYWLWKGCHKCCFRKNCFRDLCNYIFGGMLYLILFPVYTNVLGIYAICNTSEDCWGLSVNTDPQKRIQVQSVLSVRKNLFLVLFIVLNLIFGVLWEQLDITGSGDSTGKKVFLYLYYIGMLVLVLPVFGLQCLFRMIKRKQDNVEDEWRKLKIQASYPADSP